MLRTFQMTLVNTDIDNTLFKYNIIIEKGQLQNINYPLNYYYISSIIMLNRGGGGGLFIFTIIICFYVIKI